MRRCTASLSRGAAARHALEVCAAVERHGLHTLQVLRARYGVSIEADIRAIAAQDRLWAAEVAAEELRAAAAGGGGSSGEESGGEETDTDDEAGHEAADFKELRRSVFEALPHFFPGSAR